MNTKMIKYIFSILCLYTTFLFPCDNDIYLMDEYRDIDCRDTSIEFCNNDSALFSPFVCDWICRASHNTSINKCSSSGQFYSSISYQEAINLYNEVTNHLTGTTFNYNSLRNGVYGTDFPIIDHLFPFDLSFIIEDTTFGWWDDEDNDFEIGYGWSENYKKGWGHFSINDEIDSDFNVAVHSNHPLNDTRSDFISGYIFEGDLKPKWLISAGASRYSKVDTEDVNSDCDCSTGNINYGADTARSEGIDQLTCETIQYTTPMQVYHEALSDYIPNLYSLSIHGFTNIESDSLISQYSGIPSFIITNGNSVLGNNCIPPDSITSTIYHYLNDYFSGVGQYGEVNPTVLNNYNNLCASINDLTDIAVIVQQEIACENQPITCSSSDYSPFAQYGGYQNPQGRYNNGYYDINTNVGNSLIARDDIWTQIEMHSCIRNDIVLYNEVASIISQAVIDCKSGSCVVCNGNSPCSSNEGFGIDYSVYNFDCNCTVDTDCAGECGGDSFIDACGICVSADTSPDDCLDINDFIPIEFALKECYPNPFNPTTTITYHIPKFANVSIDIYNINGQLVESLYKGFKNPGEYSINWNAVNVISGAYLVTMTSGTFVETQKVMLLK